MANISKLSPIVLELEGGYTNNPKDKGGPTNMGVTLSTWKSIGYDKDGDGDIDKEDIKILSKKDFERVLRIYWNRWRADEIVSQKIANLLVDWVYTSGSYGIKIPQRILGVTQDGVVGPRTLTAVNTQSQDILFKKLYDAREKFFRDIVTNNPSQKIFLAGWLSRLKKFK